MDIDLGDRGRQRFDDVLQQVVCKWARRFDTLHLQCDRLCLETTDDNGNAPRTRRFAQDQSIGSVACRAGRYPQYFYLNLIHVLPKPASTILCLYINAICAEM